MNKIKETLKRFYPLSIRRYDVSKREDRRFLQRQINYLKTEFISFNDQLKKLISTTEEERKLYRSQIDLLRKENALLSSQLKKLEQAQTNYLKQEKQLIQDLKDSSIKQISLLDTKNKELLDNITKTTKTTIDQIIKANGLEIRKQTSNILLRLQNEQKRLERISGSVQEVVWAHIFNSTLKPEDRKITYSPGRWAAGYPCLYAMYRILGSFSPKNILELGLGQSTVMISDYVAKHPEVSHTVVERSPEWVEFFTQENNLPSATHIEVLDYDFTEYGGKEGVRIFKDFEKKVGGRKYDFVFIDAPWGFDMKDYSRIDVLRSLSADFLASSFVILVDDTNRRPETNMVNAMRSVLFGRGVATVIGKYRGDKECTVICTEDLAYLTSM